MKARHIGTDKQNSNSFGELLEASFQDQNNAEEGAPAEAIIENVKDKEYIFLKIGNKIGMLRKEELLTDDGSLSMGPGEKITVFLEETRHGDSIYTTGPKGKARESILQHALENNIPLRGSIKSRIKGGYEVTIGEANAFCPGSQMDIENPAAGTQLLFLIKEVSGRRVIASHRAYNDILRERDRQSLQEQLEEGNIISGRITSLRNFGAFVDIGGIEGLVPISEIAFQRLQHPNEAVKTGEEVRVKVIKLDWKENRITLSIRALLQNPWQGELPFKVGEIMEGKIEAIKPFGLFVKLPGHFTGLVPGSESGVDRGQNLDRHFQKGTTIKVMIASIDRVKEKVALSVKSIRDAEMEKEYKQYMKEENDARAETQVSSFGQQLKASLEKDDTK